MSDTPRTDAYEVVDGIRYVNVPRKGLPDMAAFARQLEREVAQLRAELAACREDAERYRWMADNHTEGLRLFNLWQMDDSGSEQLDAAIDAERRKEPKTIDEVRDAAVRKKETKG